MSKVNLDALIPREDFDIKDTNQGVGTRKDTISINDLRRGEFFFSVLRKPDFQRETNEWDSNKICDFIESFLEGDLIPAVILWRSASSYIFVIDGSHRLSALAAWINDHYGDGDISKQFYDGIIPDEQIDPTELRVLKARKQPNGIAARAIIRSGKGHKYWSAFSEDIQEKIQNTARDVNELLFNPELDNPIKTLDLPVGGKLYAAQSQPLVLDFINIANNVTFNDDDLGPDDDGAETLKYLNNCKRIAQRINSNHPSSLGLHPIIYFYSAIGRHKIASFFAIAALILDFEQRNYFDRFTRVRKEFESLLPRYDYLIQQIVRKYRSATASFPHIKNFYFLCIEKLEEGKDIDSTINEIIKDSKFKYLTQLQYEAEPQGQDFSRETKSAAFIREALASALRCGICNGYIHKNSISIDHITRKQDGGIGSLENAQLTHPYCNTTFKN